ncbi:MAG: hypothetical protein JSW73_04295 [Candidatus Woesearchaeota archaeon]|nr:MAG: hypothetical protein JSW73_04295 [Candidatus Woesearchaeota archaeon]
MGTLEMKLDPLKLCRGITRVAFNSVTSKREDLLKKEFDHIDVRGATHHPISQFEKDAEDAIRTFLLNESKRNKKSKVAIYFEKEKWHYFENGEETFVEVDDLSKLKPYICLLCDPIDGSKSDVPTVRSGYNKPIILGDTDKLFSTVIAFYLDKPNLQDAECCAIQRWDGYQFFADKKYAFAEKAGEMASLVSLAPLNEITLTTKLYPAAHYLHAELISTFAIQEILKELKIPENYSLGYRATGSTTNEILQATTTRSISFDIRDIVKKELQKHNIKMKRGSYAHDFAPPAFFASKVAGMNVWDFEGNTLNCNLLKEETGSYFIAPEGEASNKIYNVLRTKVIPRLPEKVKEWKDIFKYE